MFRNLITTFLVMVPFLTFSQNTDLLILNKEYNKALQLIDNELIINDAQPLLLLKKGTILQNQYDYAGSLKCLEQAYAMDSLSIPILIELADVHSALGNYRQALPYYKTIYNSDSTNTVNALKLVRGYFNQRMYMEPYQILKSAYLRDSNNIFILKQLAYSSMRCGKDSLAIVLYNKAISLNPEDLNNYTNLAVLYQKKENYPRTVETLEKGLEEFPVEIILLNKLGDVHYAKRNYAKAIITYERYLSVGDSIYDVLKNLGISYYYEKRTQEGLDLLDICLIMKPNDPITGLFIGLCYKDLNQDEESLSYLNFAAKVALPNYLADIYNQLGILYAQKKSFKRSVSLLKKAYSQDSTRCEILFKIGNTYDEWQKDKSLAIRYYNAYLKSKREKTEFHEQLTQYVLDRKRKLGM